MIKLVCSKCKKIWYTSNTEDGQKCDDCGGKLRVVAMEKADKNTVKKQ